MQMQAELQVVFQILIAGGLGAVIGLERELRERPAGLRTHILVAAGSALFLSLGRALMLEPGNGLVNIRPDPLRVLEAVVTGISFIGAGTIMFHRGEGRLEGITTAASILVTAGVGVAVALRLYVVAGIVTLLVFGVLRSLASMEEKIVRPAADEKAPADQS